MNLNIAYLYPRSMNIYGDRGNIITLTKRCQWRDINVKVTEIETGEQLDSTKYDLFFAGGGQDKSQLRIADDLITKKEEIHKAVQNGKVFLLICGTYQLFGHYFITKDGQKIPGISVLDIHTVASSQRKIGNVIIDCDKQFYHHPNKSSIVGFENHSGNTFINKPSFVKRDTRRSMAGRFSDNNTQSDQTIPFGTIVSGYGNNDDDKFEGAVFKNVFGSYLHGSLLPKNPHFADHLIKLALETKYKKKINLKQLDDSLETKAHNFIIQNK